MVDTDLKSAEARLNAALRERDLDGNKRQYTDGEIRQLREAVFVAQNNVQAEKAFT